tara:strand:- start:6847 stop:7194 length:348 start_codon:yes stop_codon:yes gene_type:complete
MPKENLKCQDFYFYPNGEYKTVSKWSSQLYTFDNDTKEISTHIRIFGTEKQIDSALDDYCTISQLNLDEAFDFCVDKKGSHFYNAENNKKVAARLKEYKKIYKANNKKGLIINIK